MPRQTRAQMAAEYQARMRADRAQKLKAAMASASVRTGDTQSIFGRIIQAGEQPGMAPFGSSEAVAGTEESQELTRPWNMGGGRDGER